MEGKKEHFKKGFHLVYDKVWDEEEKKEIKKNKMNNLINKCFYLPIWFHFLWSIFRKINFVFLDQKFYTEFSDASWKNGICRLLNRLHYLPGVVVS